MRKEFQMEGKKEIGYTLNLKLYRQEKFFGPGLARLLTLVEETNSLRMAAAKMNMAYSKAWKMIKKAEENLGFDLLETKTGGKGGGGARLTPNARETLKLYNDFERAVYRNADEYWELFYKGIMELSRRAPESYEQPDKNLHPQVGAIVMASGFSRRMGCNKMLLNLGEKTVIRHILEQINRIDFDEKIVVSQHEKIRIIGQELGFMAVDNPQAQQGKSSSIKIALKSLPPMEGYCFLTGDQILLTDELLGNLLTVFRQNPERIIIPTYKGEWGAPTIFPGDLKDELLKLEGEEGGRKVAENNAGRIMTVEAEPFWQGMDFDTPEEWICVKTLFEEQKIG